MPLTTSLLVASILLIAHQALFGPRILFEYVDVDMRGLASGFATGLSLLGLVSGQACQTTTLRNTIPSNGTEVALRSYSYCGGTLNVTAYIANLGFNKIVNLYYTDRQGESTPLSIVGLDYQSSIGNDSTWESWGANTPIYIDGITELLNLTYQAVDLGETYVQQLNLPVEASGAPEPSLPSPPAPYAAPSGFSRDITRWLRPNPSGSQADLSLERMFVNINPAIDGADNGTVVAARSGPSYEQEIPDYEYNWVRDAALTMEVVERLYAAATDRSASESYEQVLFQYAQARATEQNAEDLISGLGEPKFYLNNTAFTEPWGRPQNDGPATASITLIEFANAYLDKGGDVDTVMQQIWDSTEFPESAPVKRDLLFVASNWTSISFDLWEEVQGDHFYNRMVQRRAMLLGAEFATRLGDAETASTLAGEVDAITATLEQFWDPNREIILYVYGPVLRGKASYLDMAVVLAVMHGYAGDGVYSYTNDQIMSSALRISTSFIDVYPIANITENDAGTTIGLPVGRYPEDIYNGIDTSPNGGNPWYLTTAAMAQYMYSASAEYDDAGCITVTDINLSFFNYFAPDVKVRAGKTYCSKSRTYRALIASLNGWGDAFMRRVQFQTPTDQRLSEQYDKETSEQVGAADLTWSYASVLTAALARAEARGEKNYAKRLANMGFEPNE